MRARRCSTSWRTTPNPEERTTASSAASARSAGADPALLRLSLTVGPDAADRVRGVLVDHAPAGWEENEAEGHTTVTWWTDAADDAGLAAVIGALSAAGVDARPAQAVEGDAWKDGLRRHHQPVEIAGTVRIRPPWTPPEAGLIDVVIEPAMAFGTGQHATTRGCLALLVDAPSGSLLDVGCGSGVLAIAAAKLGYAPVTALDNDPIAVDATRENAAINGVALAVAAGDSDRDVLPAAETVVANILAVPVIALAGALGEPLPRRAVLSGFRPSAVDEVVAAWARRGYRLDRRIDEDGWSAIRLAHG